MSKRKLAAIENAYLEQAGTELDDIEYEYRVTGCGGGTGRCSEWTDFDTALEDWIAPIASESVVDPTARKTLLSRNSVSQ